MRFSIIIPTFNRADLLADAIRSALSQSYLNKEIVIVDDGSADPTESVVRAFGSAVRYVRQLNQGKAAALNVGISATQGDVLIVLDDDDIFPPQTLAKHAAALSANPSATFSYGRYLRFKGSAPPSVRQLEEGHLCPSDDPRRLVIKLMENCFIPNPCWAVRRAAQLSAGPYEPGLARSQDFDMVIRLAKTNEGAFIDDVVLFQRKHLGYRGPLLDQTVAVDTIEKWIKYDCIIFKRLGREWKLGDFHPFGSDTNKPFDYALALLQKGIILFRRKVYDVAGSVLTEYRSLLSGREPTSIELKIATGLLGSSNGIDDLIVPASLGRNVACVFGRPDWPMSMRIAFGWQLRWRFRRAIETCDLLAALRLLRFSQRVFGWDATATLGFRSPKSFGDWSEIAHSPDDQMHKVH
jgi:glycosyltransferase involved in cell wall biosynthesis